MWRPLHAHGEARRLVGLIHYAKIIEIGRDLQKLLLKVYCHFLWST